MTSKQLAWLGLVVVSVGAGYGVYANVWSFSPPSPPWGGRALIHHDWVEAVQMLVGTGVAILFGFVAFGLVRLVHVLPRKDGRLVFMAWAGWVLFGAALALGASLAEAVRTFEESHVRTAAGWVIARGLLAGLVWAAVILAGLYACLRGAGCNRLTRRST